MVTNTDLIRHIMEKNPDGIPSEDAKQIFFSLYITLGILPERFRQLKLGRAELAQVFATLAAEGKITSDAEPGESVDNFKDEAYWRNLVDLFLLKKETFDDSLYHRWVSILA